MPKSSPSFTTPQRQSYQRYSPVLPSPPRTNSSASPSSQLRYSRYNGRMSHRSSMDDSPSRQLIEDLTRMMIDQTREFYAALDEASEKQEKAHTAALAAAALEHEKIRRSAEIARERHELEILKERRRREEEEQDRLEQARKEEENAEHARKLAELKKQEEELKAAAAKAKELADAESRINAEKQKQAAEDARRKVEKQESDRKSQEAAAAAARDASAKAAAQTKTASAPVQAQAPTITTNAAQPQGQAAPTQSSTTSPLVSSLAEREAIHQEYLGVHARLKELRVQVMAQGKGNKNIGEVRRKLKARVGQITTESKSNVEIRKHIMEMFKQSMAEGQPQVDIRPYLTSASPISKEQGPCMMPVLLIYYLHMFCKFVCKQLCTEVGNASNMSEPIMIQVAFVFSDPTFFWNGHSLIDILLSKFHKACPVLFGIYGPENTKAGRARLGWQTIGGDFVPEPEHRRRIEGFASGFAGIALRNFSKTSRKNPMPNTAYWAAMARIVDTPAQDLTKTHIIVLRNLIEKYPERFISIYGQMAVVALRHAVVEFPKKAAARFPNEAKELSNLPEVFRRDLRLNL